MACTDVQKRRFGVGLRGVVRGPTAVHLGVRSIRWCECARFDVRYRMDVVLLPLTFGQGSMFAGRMGGCGATE